MVLSSPSAEDHVIGCRIVRCVFVNLEVPVFDLRRHGKELRGRKRSTEGVRSHARQRGPLSGRFNVREIDTPGRLPLPGWTPEGRHQMIRFRQRRKHRDVNDSTHAGVRLRRPPIRGVTWKATSSGGGGAPAVHPGN